MKDILAWLADQGCAPKILHVWTDGCSAQFRYGTAALSAAVAPLPPTLRRCRAVAHHLCAAAPPPPFRRRCAPAAHHLCSLVQVHRQTPVAGGAVS